MITTKSVSEAFVSFEPEKSFDLMWSHNIVPFPISRFFFLFHLDFHFHFHFGFSEWFSGCGWPRKTNEKPSKWMNKLIRANRTSSIAQGNKRCTKYEYTRMTSNHRYYVVLHTNPWSLLLLCSSSLIDGKTTLTKYIDSEFHSSWTGKQFMTIALPWQERMMQHTTLMLSIRQITDSRRRRHKINENVERKETTNNTKTQKLRNLYPSVCYNVMNDAMNDERNSWSDCSTRHEMKKRETKITKSSIKTVHRSTPHTHFIYLFIYVTC